MIYHDGARRLQDRFDSRRLAERLVEKLWRTAFSAEDKAFIEASHMFFLATADASGRPDCSYKGGLPGFVRVTGPSELSFPSYDGYRLVETSVYAPRPGYEPPAPAWKQNFKDVLPRG